jgi:hypothetical protein
MDELLKRIFLAFEEISDNMSCNSDFYKLPTYWHIDGVPFSLYKNEKSITVVSHKEFPKKILITEDKSKDEIVKLIYKNFIY